MVNIFTASEFIQLEYSLLRIVPFNYWGGNKGQPSTDTSYEVNPVAQPDTIILTASHRMPNFVTPILAVRRGLNRFQ